MNVEETPQHSPTPKNVLDSILTDGGSMPTARLGIRTLAFLIDFIFITVIATFIIWKIALPKAHPTAFNEFDTWTQEFVLWLNEYGTNNGVESPKWSDNLTEALIYAHDLQMLIFWLYFSVGEAFFAGRSIGKCACRLRSISTTTMEAPPVMIGFFRGALKTLVLFFIFPIALLATLGALFFNKRRQMGHDLICRTAVIDEKYIRSMPTTEVLES